MKKRDTQIDNLRQQIREISVREAHDQLAKGHQLIDIREPDEVAAGMPEGACHLVRGFLELRIEDQVEDPDTPLMLMCAGGVRSLFAADALKRMGYSEVVSVAGGFNAWKTEGLPVVIPDMLNSQQRERYARHLLIPEVGEAGQRQLIGGKVLLVGAGGLGSPAALYLAAAGVGTLGIIDDDVVDRSNLQRQILHSEERVGMLKVESAKIAIHQLNPEVTVNTYPCRLTSDNVDDILPQYDVVIDGADNFPTRYLVNDACVKHKVPNVHGSIFRFEGQVSVFWPAHPTRPGPCYRCLYPEPPPPELAPSCAEAGVLGVLPGAVGILEAIEAIKILLDTGSPLVGQLLHVDAMKTRFSTFKLQRDPQCPVCADGINFPGYVDYTEFCAR